MASPSGRRVDRAAGYQFRVRGDVVEVDIPRFGWNGFHFLERVTDADQQRRSGARRVPQETKAGVIPATAGAETMALPVEGQQRQQDDVHVLRGQALVRRSDGLGNAETIV